MFHLYSERLQIRHALAHELFVHLDEVVLYAAGLCGAERLDPVDAALPDRRLRTASAAAGAAVWRGGGNGRVHVEVLQMHRDETIGVRREVISGDQAARDRRHLELELHELRVEQVEEHVEDALAVDHRQLKALGVEPLLQPGLPGLGADCVVSVSEPLDIVHRRIARAVEARHHDLREPALFRPADGLRQLLGRELGHVHVRADASEIVIRQHARELCGGDRVQAPEAEIVLRVPGGAELDRLDARVRQHLHRARKVLVDGFAVRKRLAADRPAIRTGAEDGALGERRPRGSGGAAGCVLNERASRDGRHFTLLGDGHARIDALSYATVSPFKNATLLTVKSQFCSTKYVLTPPIFAAWNTLTQSTLSSPTASPGLPPRPPAPPARPPAPPARAARAASASAICSGVGFGTGMPARDSRIPRVTSTPCRCMEANRPGWL